MNLKGPRVVVVEGRSTGHIEHEVSFADSLRRLDPSTEVTALGTVRESDTTFNAARGYPLELIPPVPSPRTLNWDLMRAPFRLRNSVRAAGAVLDRTQAEVVVGFDGCMAAPAYLAARWRRLPIVLYEAHARLANATVTGVPEALSEAAAPNAGLALARYVLTAVIAERRRCASLEAERSWVDN